MRKMSETSVKNEEGCRDDTMPKTVETRRHCESMQQSTSQCLLVSTVFGTVSSLHPSSFLDLCNNEWKNVVLLLCIVYEISFFLGQNF